MISSPGRGDYSPERLLMMNWCWYLLWRVASDFLFYAAFVLVPNELVYMCDVQCVLFWAQTWAPRPRASHAALRPAMDVQLCDLYQLQPIQHSPTCPEVELAVLWDVGHLGMQETAQSSSPFLFEFAVGGFEFCVLVSNWRHAFRSAWVCLFAVVGGVLCKSDKPSIIIIFGVSGLYYYVLLLKWIAC